MNTSTPNPKTRHGTASCPALLITAPASGQGKTTVVSALARLLARQGLRVQVFKCGPDFIDASWHALASDQAVHQLDLWINGEADIQARLHRAAQQNDIILVEGVMGLYDGQPCSADIARRFALPVMPVISARAMAGTFGALAFGLQHFVDPRAPKTQEALRWAGVLANQVGSTGHAQMLADSLPAPNFLGAIPYKADFCLPERHLGLTLPAELADGLARLDALADALAQTPLGQMQLADWQRWAVDFAPPAGADAAPLPALLAGKTIAVARDAAFCFIYQANLDCLASMGAKLAFFSPVAGDALPPCDALWLPGGYPELHSTALAAAQQSRASIAQHVQAGKPVWAECGGMMQLFDSITQKDGSSQPAWGLLAGSVAMQARFVGLGSQSWQTAQGQLRGHTFHHSRTSTALQPAAHTLHAKTGQVGEAVYRAGSITASYFHAWFASNPAATAALFGVDAVQEPAAQEAAQGAVPC
jgi:cobyrinic acid a,c-diamide synthase